MHRYAGYRECGPGATDETQDAATAADQSREGAPYCVFVKFLLCGHMLKSLNLWLTKGCNKTMKDIRMMKRDGNQMGIVIDMREFQKNREAKISSYTIKDLISDPGKRKEFDDFYLGCYEYIENDDFAKKIFGRKAVSGVGHQDPPGADGSEGEKAISAAGRIIEENHEAFKELAEDNGAKGENK